MPKKTDIKKILIIGAGPVVIGQGSELDTFAAGCIVWFKQLGYKTALMDCNPASLAADIADEVYFEPLNLASFKDVLNISKADAVFAASGASIASELIRQAAESGMEINIIGNSYNTITLCEDRSQFKKVLAENGISSVNYREANSLEEGMHAASEFGLPFMVKPCFASSGFGCAPAYNMEEYVGILSNAFEISPINKVIIEELLTEGIEFQFVVLSDSDGNTKTLLAVENLIKFGVHSGDCEYVYPVQSISEIEYENLSNIAQNTARAIKASGCSYIKLIYNKQTKTTNVISANAYAGRLAGFAYKVMSYDLAKASVELSLGFRMSEIDAITHDSEIVCVRVPVFAFDRFPDSDPLLGASMKSVGEVLGIGSSFNEAYQKANRAVYEENNYADGNKEACEFVKSIANKSLVSLSSEMLYKAKAVGFSDFDLAAILETDEEQVRLRRKILGISPVYKIIEKNGAVFSSYSNKNSINFATKTILVIGSPYNSIGNGSQYSYSTIQAAKAVKGLGYNAVIVSANASLCAGNGIDIIVEPINLESILSIIEATKPEAVITAFGGNTAAEIGSKLSKLGVKILGTRQEVIDGVHDRKLISKLAKKLGLSQSENGFADSVKNALSIAEKVGYPLIARAANQYAKLTREIIYDSDDLTLYVQEALKSIFNGGVRLERFLEDAIEVDVDIVSDGSKSIICAVMEHIEQAGIHAGDSASSIPCYSLENSVVEVIKKQSIALADELKVIGLMKAHYAVHDNNVYLLGLNVGCSATVPFVSRATEVNWARVAAKILMGVSLEEQGLEQPEFIDKVAVREAVFPFARLKGADVVLGPQMKSTGEVMAINSDFGHAYIKAQIASGQVLPTSGNVFISVANRDKKYIPELGKKLSELGLNIIATDGTGDILKENGIPCRVIAKLGESRPDAIDLIKNGEIDLIINTRSGKKPRAHEISIRSAIVVRGVPIITTIAGAKATLSGMAAVKE